MANFIINQDQSRRCDFIFSGKSNLNAQMASTITRIISHRLYSECDELKLKAMKPLPHSYAKMRDAQNDDIREHLVSTFKDRISQCLKAKGDFCRRDADNMREHCCIIIRELNFFQRKTPIWLYCAKKSLCSGAVVS